MSIKWGEPLVKGLKFGFNPKRWLPLFALDAVFIILFTTVFLNNLLMLIMLAGISESPEMIMSALGDLSGIIGLGVIWGLLKIWLVGSVIHQSFKEKEFQESFRVSLKRYPHFLAVTLISAVVGMVAGMIPWIGTFASIVAALVFMFSQVIAIRGEKTIKAIRESWEIFRKNPLKVLVMWILIAVITTVIVMVFIAPVMVMIFSMFGGALASGEPTMAAAAAMSLIGNPTWLIVGIAVALVGIAISTTFAAKTLVEYYQQIKKKFKAF